MKSYLRQQTRSLIKRLYQPAGLIQVVAGPRQVGKTTAVNQTIGKLKFQAVSATADAPSPPPLSWISEHWSAARQIASGKKPALLALDEIQKIPGWSEVVKKEFDRDERLQRSRRPRVVLLGSSALLMERGLTESLAGRFELLRFPHWSWKEEKEAFGLDLPTHIALGGYPRLHEFLPDAARFRDYVKNSIIESVLGKDILLLHPVEKPALLRRLFEFACFHPAEILSLQKMMGQLTDKGNAATLAHYLELLSKAFLVIGLQKYSPEILRVRASSPKLLVYSQALLAAFQGQDAGTLPKNQALYGRWAENAVGAHLLNSGFEVFYWRERDLEVDFVARKNGEITAIEVGVGKKQKNPSSLKIFASRFGVKKTIVISPAPGHIPLEEFLNS